MEEKKSFLNEKIDLESPNKNIVPITTSIGSDGKLIIGGCSIEELVKKYDSPLYILDEFNLRCFVLLILSNNVFKYSIPKPNLLSNDPVFMYS